MNHGNDPNRHLGLLALLGAALCFPAHSQGNDPVDLTLQEHRSIVVDRPTDGDNSHPLSNPWWENLDIYGFGAVGYYDTGSDATRANGGFEIKEASLFIEADVWLDTDFFIELQTNRLGKDNQLFTRTGEVYIHFRELQLGSSNPFGVKVGRIDIPFGEEYLWQDAIDNPLISNSAAYPYGWDEGLLVYGDVGGVSWIAAIMDGTDARSEDDNTDKALAVKASGHLLESLYLSASIMRNGDAAKSAIEFGGSHFEPVGASHVSTLGASASPQVSADLFEINAKYDLSTLASGRYSYLALTVGAARQKDTDPGFDRDFRWLTIEPYITINAHWFAVLRYSVIGTHDDAAGYHFDGKTFAGGNGAFGYDVRRFRRLAAGIGWLPNPNVRVKFEVGDDQFALVGNSPLPNGGDRKFIAAEIAVGF